MAQAGTTASFGYWVRRQRLALDLTQTDLARQVGCATVTISKIERDERRPSRQMAGLLADNLAIPDDERERFLDVALGERAVDRMPLAEQPLELLIGGDDESPRTNLPTPSTPFVGRIQELQQLQNRLQDPTCRLLTLVGPGGFGKTRLAMRLGELSLTQEEWFAGGVFFVALDGLESADLVVPAIAAALRFMFYEQKDQESQLLNYLERKRLLLILDNAEHILEGDLINRILPRAPQVKIVVTSREALHLQQEWFHPIDGMKIEQEEVAGKEGSHPDAVRLFQQCARRSRPGFDLERELAHVQQICRLVDGAPLAIELAAAWLRAMSCAQIAQELESNLDLLSTTMGDVPARHRSMRAVLEQSWDYLSAEEQQVFRRLSVFVGGFRADAAESIAEASLSTLASLVEKSALQLGRDGRYLIHALLRQLGTEKLADQPEELASVQAGHCDYYMAFLQDRRQSIAGREQKAVLGEVQADLDNIRIAWSYATEHSRLEDLGGAFACLFRYLWTRGRYEEGERLTAEALDALDPATLTDEHHSIQIVITARRAQFVSARGDHRRALAMLDDAQIRAKRSGTLHEQALCYYVGGTIAERASDEDRAVKNFRAAHRILRDLNDIAGTGETALRLGFAVFSQKGDLTTGQRLAEEGLRLFREIGDLSSIADALDRTAVMRVMSGEIDDAEKYYHESLALARDVGHRLVIARAVGGLSMVAWARGQWDLVVVQE